MWRTLFFPVFGKVFEFTFLLEVAGEERPDFFAGVHVFFEPAMRSVFHFVEPHIGIVGGVAEFHLYYAAVKLCVGNSHCVEFHFGAVVGTYDF